MSFGGNDSPPPAPMYAAPPAPPEIAHVADEITETETFPTTDPTTGRRKLVTRSLPLSPKKQAWLDRAQSLMETSVNELERLNNYGPQNIIDFMPYVDFINTLSEERAQDLQRLLPNRDFTDFINSFRTARQAALDEQFEQQRNQLQVDLSRSGWGNSTAAHELKAALAAQQAKANIQLDADSIEYGQKLYDRDLVRRSNEFGFAEQGRASRMSDMQNKYLLEKEQKNSLEEQRQKEIGHNQMLYGIGDSVLGAHTQKQMSTMAPKLALAENQLTAQNQLNTYNSDINRQQLTYQNQLSNYNNQPPSFGQQLMTIGGQVAGGWMAGPTGAAVGGQAAGAIAGNKPSWGNIVPQSNPNMPVVPQNQVGQLRRQ